MVAIPYQDQLKGVLTHQKFSSALMPSLSQPKAGKYKCQDERGIGDNAL